MYQFIRWILFRFDPEAVHYFSMTMLRMACEIGITERMIRSAFRPKPGRERTWLGLPFPNPVGLAAGFDKNAAYLKELDCLGFGFVEIGTVTPLPQAGNEKPRLFRLPKDKALINRMGFNNDGMQVVAENLKRWRMNPRAQGDGRMMVGGNIGKNKQTPNELAWKDYLACFERLHPYVDYFVVNVSSPNTPGLRALQEKDSLQQIFERLQGSAIQQKNKKPVLLKIAPDLHREQIDEIIALCLHTGIDGLIVSNTSIRRDGLMTAQNQIDRIGAGGLSGAPVKLMSTELIRYITEKSENRIPVIGSGGIFSAQDAREKLEAGAGLVQVWTGFVYEGPSIVKKINKKIS